MRRMDTNPHQRASRKGRKEEKLKREVAHLFINGTHFVGLCNDDCGVLASHNIEGHVHESHGHNTAGSPGHEEKSEEEEESRERTAEKRGNMCRCRDATAIDD